MLLLDPLDNATDAPDEGLLSDVQISDLVLAAREMTPTGALDRQQFHVLFQRVSGNLSPLASEQMEVRATPRLRLAGAQRPESPAYARAPTQQVNLNRLFDVFDRDGNGVVDTTELLTGLSVLTKGQGDDKIRATFHMYDTDGAFVCHGARTRRPLSPNGPRQGVSFSRRTGDGYISLAEMSRYMRSVFAVIAETSPEQFEGFGVNPDELADATARRCLRSPTSTRTAGAWQHRLRTLLCALFCV